MKLKSPLTASLIAILAFGACKSGPVRPNFIRNTHGGGGGGNTGGGESNPGTSKDPKDDPANPDPIALRNTLDKILQPTGGAQDAECEAKPKSSKTHLRKLTADEYQNSVKDIFQLTTDYRGMLPTDTTLMGFRNNADAAIITDSHAEKYLDVSIAIADEIKSKLPALVNCQESEGAACASKVIDTLGPKIYRRPLDASEKTSLLNLHKTGLASSARDGMSLLISSLLMSPNFLYRSEIGKDGVLTAYELASALSYFFWGTTPDSELVAKAAAGELLSETILMAQADRLWTSPRSKFAAVEFTNVWLESGKVKGATKDPAKFPQFQDSIRTAMAVEAEETLSFLLKQKDADFESLFTNDFSIGSDVLAQHYKGQLTTENGVSKIKFPNTPRKGVLGLGAVLAHLATASETHPIKRGEFVLKNMFCHIPLPTPPGLEVKVPEQKEGLTTRERFAAHTANAVCASCHVAIDGIGFGMEDFDTTGLYREIDNGRQVNATGEIHEVDSAVAKFTGVGELSEYISASKQAKRCYVVQWYRLAHGYIERPADVCAIRDLANKFEKDTISLGQLLIEIVTHNSYTKKGE